MLDHPALLINPPGGHRHFAIAIVDKQKYTGWNNRKTNPDIIRKKDGIILAGYHAETHVLKKIPKDKRGKAKIYIMRIRKDGTLGLSKPCQHCEATLLEAGIKRKNIWYSTNKQTWRCLTNDKIIKESNSLFERTWSQRLLVSMQG